MATNLVQHVQQCFNDTILTRWITRPKECERCSFSEGYEFGLNEARVASITQRRQKESGTKFKYP